MKYFINHDEILDIISFQIVFNVKVIDNKGMDSINPLTKDDKSKVLEWFIDKNDNKLNGLNVFNFEINSLISTPDRFLMRFDMDFKDYDPVYFSRLVKELLDVEEEFFSRKNEYVTFKGYLI